MAPSPDPEPTTPASGEALAAPRRGLLAAGWAKFSDNAIPGLVVAVIAGLTLFFFNEASNRMTRIEDRITRLEAEMDARFTTLEENQQQMAVTLATLVADFAAFQENVDNRFAAIDARFAAVDNRFAAIDTRFAAIDARFARLEENQQEIAVTLAKLVALLEAGDEH